MAASIPNTGILLSTLPLQEARDSSAIENIVTTQDERFQAELVQDGAGFRRVPGTVLRDQTGRVIYTPPQDPTEVVRLMDRLGRFMNDEPAYPVDPLIRMALIHHQFESIHSFHDGNGRTGRIVNVLYLVTEGLLDLPILNLSRHIVQTKARYYALLQVVRDDDAWEPWVEYMLNVDSPLGGIARRWRRMGSS